MLKTAVMSARFISLGMLLGYAQHRQAQPGQWARAGQPPPTPRPTSRRCPGTASGCCEGVDKGSSSLANPQ